MQLGALASACLAVVARQAAAQPSWPNAPPPDGEPFHFHVEKDQLQSCNSLNWGNPICLSGHTLVNVSWKSSGQQPAPATVVFNNPNISFGHSTAAAWCANVSVVASSGLTLFGCNKTVDQVRLLSVLPSSRMGAFLAGFLTAAYCFAVAREQNGCSECLETIPRVALKPGDPKSWINITSSKQQTDTEGFYFSLEWNNQSKVVADEGWIVIHVEPYKCGRAYGQINTRGVMLTLIINFTCVLIAYLGVSLIWTRSVRKQERGGLGAGHGSGRSSSNAVSASVQAREDGVGRRMSVQSILVESAMVEKTVWRTNFMKSHPFSWPYHIMLEPDETFVKMAGRRVIPYLRFQRILIGLYAVMTACSLVLIVVNLVGYCCQSTTCGAGVADSGLVPTTDFMCISSSQNIVQDGWQLYVHFAGVVIFSCATMFVARGVKRGDRLSALGLLSAVVSVLKCEKPASPWRFDKATNANARDFARIPRQAFSAMVRYVPITLHQCDDGVHKDMQSRFAEYCDSVGCGWKVLDVTVHTTAGQPTCTAFVTFAQATHAHEFVASHCEKYRTGWVTCRPWRARARPAGVRRLPPPPMEFDMHEWEVAPGPDASDVEWDYLNISYLESLFREIVSFSVLMPISILCSFSIPIASQLADLSNAFFTSVNLREIQLKPPHSKMEGALQSVPVDSECNEYCALMSKYLPSVVQVLLTVGLVPAVIDLLAPFEGHFLKNQLYRSVLRKNMFLLLFTILICPTVALSTAADLFQYVRQALHPDQCSVAEGNGYAGPDWMSDLNRPFVWASDSFGQAFLENNGPFFILFMLQAWVLGTAAALCLMPLAGWTCCNACLPRCILGCIPGGRFLWEFPLEYNYAINCTIYAVVLTYSVAFPSIIPIGLCFGAFRYATDRYTLLFAHQGNLDRHFADEDDDEGTEKRRRSEVLVCNTVGNSMIFSVMLFNIAMVGYYRQKNLSLMGATIILSLLFIAVTARVACCGKANAAKSINDPALIESIQARSSPSMSPTNSPRYKGPPSVTFSGDSNGNGAGSGDVTKLTLSPTNDLRAPLTGGVGDNSAAGVDLILDSDAKPEPFALSQSWESTPRYPQTPRSTALSPEMARKVSQLK